MTNFVELANKIIEERGGDKYKEQWLRGWLLEKENEDKMMQTLMMKELTAEAAQQIKSKKKQFVKRKVGLC